MTNVTEDLTIKKIENWLNNDEEQEQKQNKISDLLTLQDKMCFNFPELIKNAIKKKKYTYNIIIMAKMKIVCITIDDFLYVIDMLQENNFVEFRLKDEIITCVTSITNKEIEWSQNGRLLLCTNKQILVIGISTQENALKITILKEYTFKLEGKSIMTCIFSTRNERVFLTDEESNLYELMFNSSIGLSMRRKSCLNLTCHTRSLNNIFHMKEKTKNPVILMVEDTEKHFLHLLHEDGVIDIYSLGKGLSQGTSRPEKYARISELDELENEEKFINIDPISRKESDMIILAGITTHERIFYFKDKKMNASFAGWNKPFASFSEGLDDIEISHIISLRKKNENESDTDTDTGTGTDDSLCLKSSLKYHDSYVTATSAKDENRNYEKSYISCVYYTPIFRENSLKLLYLEDLIVLPGEILCMAEIDESLLWEDNENSDKEEDRKKNKLEKSCLYLKDEIVTLDRKLAVVTTDKIAVITKNTLFSRFGSILQGLGPRCTITEKLEHFTDDFGSKISAIFCVMQNHRNYETYFPWLDDTVHGDFSYAYCGIRYTYHTLWSIIKDDLILKKGIGCNHNKYKLSWLLEKFGQLKLFNNKVTNKINVTHNQICLLEKITLHIDQILECIHVLIIFRDHSISIYDLISEFKNAEQNDIHSICIKDMVKQRELIRRILIKKISTSSRIDNIKVTLQNKAPMFYQRIS